MSEANFLRAITGHCAGDLNRARENLDEAEMDYAEFAEFLNEDNGDYEAGAPDIVALSLQFIAIKAGANELNEFLYSNYLDSSFDIADDKAGEILYAIGKVERGAAWRFLVGLTDAEEPVDEPLDAEPDECDEGTADVVGGAYLSLRESNRN